MPLSITDRARKYVAQMDPALSGAGGHSSTFSVACALVKGFAFSPEEALPLMEEYNARCEPPWSLPDLQHKLRSAAQSADKKPIGYLLEGKPREEMKDGVAPAPRNEEKKSRRYEITALRTFTAGCRQQVDRVWLAERSPFAVEWGNRPGLAADVLSMLFAPEDLVVMMKRKWNKGDFAVWKARSFRLGQDPDTKAVASEIPTESNAGMLLMAAPIDGKWRPGGKDKKGNVKWSRRTAACVTHFPYLVLESDEAPLDLWLRAIAMLELRIAAIFSSGGKSVHALIRIDAKSKVEFDDCAQVLAGVLEVIGADAQAAKGLPMSRVPGVKRIETGKIQELWYLDPDPAWGRLVDRRPKRTIAAAE